MSMNTLVTRDLLYPTENIFEPGSVHVEVYNPNKKAKIPVVIENKTHHSPVKYLDSILRIMQGDIFDRVFVDIRKNVNLYIKVNDAMKSEYGNAEYIAVSFLENGIEFSGTDIVEI